MPRGVRRKMTIVKNGRRGPRGPMSGLKGAVAGLATYRNRLVAQRDALDAEIGALDNALAVIGAAQPARAYQPAAGGGMKRGPRGTRGPRKGSLKEYVNKVLVAVGGTMAVKDITAGVVRAGYKTHNKTLAKSVGIALTEMRNVRKVGRGKFRLK